MYVYQRDLLVFLAASFITGIVLSLLYDVLRVLRMARCGQVIHSRSPEYTIGTARIFCRYNDHRNNRIKKSDSIGKLVLFFFEDVMFFSVVSVIVVLLFYGFNWGRARMFSVVALIFGFFTWRYTVGWIVMLVFEYVFYIVGSLVYFLLYPFAFLGLKIKKVIYKSISMIYNKYENDKSIRRKKNQEMKLRSQKEKMKRVKMNVVVMERR